MQLTFAVAALLALLMLGRFAGIDEGPDASSAKGQAPSGMGDYPEEWTTSLSQARARVPFELNVPNHPNANDQNVTAVFLWPEEHAVAIRYPAPAPPVTPLRQDFIEVFETSWSGGDPEARWAEDVAADPVVGKEIRYIEGVPALAVGAHSPTDRDQANAAFLRFVLDGVDIQISGGESLERLIGIARSMIRH